MANVQEKIKELEETLAKSKYNKHTQKAHGMMKAKLAQLRTEATHSASKKSQNVSGVYAVRKSGDASAVLIGFPSVGKSTLLNKLTGAQSEVGAYEFTTLDVVPGMMHYKFADIQILDVPGIIQGASQGRGRGKEVIGVARTADLIVIMADVFRCHTLAVLKHELFDAGIRLDQNKPDVKVTMKARGGLTIGSTVPLTNIGEIEIREILNTYKIQNGVCLIRDDITDDQLIDVLEGNRVYIPSLLVINKVDQITVGELNEMKELYRPDICISADQEFGLDELKEKIYQKLNLISVFCKERGKKADMNEPLIMKHGCTVKDVCDRLHKDFIKKFTFCKVWGKSAKFPGQKHLLSHHLKDGDVIEIHAR